MSAIYECECDRFEMYEEQDSFEMAEAVPGPGVPSGGLTGQVLKKRSDEDFDTEWADESGGGGGTSDYTHLSNKPQINGHTLTGNQTGAQLGLVDAVSGKQLSTEDYTTADKNKLSGIEAQANKTVIDSTLTNAGQAADAKKTGDEISDLKNTLMQLETTTQHIIPVLTGAVNDLGYTLQVGGYFEVGGNLYKVSAAIPDGATWADKSTALSSPAINDIKNSLELREVTTYFATTASNSVVVNVTAPTVQNKKLIGYSGLYYTLNGTGACIPSFGNVSGNVYTFNVFSNIDTSNSALHVFFLYF